MGNSADNKYADRIRIPSEENANKLLNVINTDDDFRFPRLKLDKGNAKWLIPAPTASDKDETEAVRSFEAVVLFFRKNFYATPEEKNAGA